MTHPLPLNISLPENFNFAAARSVSSRIIRAINQHQSAARPGELKITLDFSGTTTIDSSGLALILSLLQHKEQNVRYEIVSMSAPIASVFKALRLPPVAADHRGRARWLSLGSALVLAVVGFLVYPAL